ncbi:MAG: Organic hydroperoxide resistance transcriptional regulator [Myxococcales bacterium]|nr:Organic hydroperoxide resistance transcriptional regulator [Myxococcales bacterium]
MGDSHKRRAAGEALELDRQLCFLLYGASRAVTQAYQPLLAPLGLTYPQYLVMLVLWETDGVSVGTLCDRLYLDSGTLTPLITRLETAGLVERARSRTDARVVDVHLTTAGRRLERAAARVPEALLCRLGVDATQLPRIHHELKQLFDLVTKEKAA